SIWSAADSGRSTARSHHRCGTTEIAFSCVRGCQRVARVTITVGTDRNCQRMRAGLLCGEPVAHWTSLMPRSRRDRPPGGPRTVIPVIQWLLAADAELTVTGTPLLTKAGVIYLRELLVTAAPAKERKARREASERRPLPHWDTGPRRLWLGVRLLH